MSRHVVELIRSKGSLSCGYKASGFGRETHEMMLDHYQQTKNLLVSYSNQALGLF